MSINNRLKLYRTIKGLSQVEMAELLHKSQSTYSRMESGEIKINIDDLNDIANIFGCSVEDLIQDTTTINIQHNNQKAFADIYHQQNTFSDNSDFFKELMANILNHQKESDRRFRDFIKEIIATIKK